MKTLVKRFKYLPIALAMLILFQGCTVYKNQSVTMQEAAQKQVKTKVKTSNGDLFFKYIAFENDNYYGIKKFKGELEKIRLDSEYIESIHLTNKTMTTILTIGFPIGVIAITAVFIFQNKTSNKRGYGDLSF